MNIRPGPRVSSRRSEDLPMLGTLLVLALAQGRAHVGATIHTHSPGGHGALHARTGHAHGFGRGGWGPLYSTGCADAEADDQCWDVTPRDEWWESQTRAPEPPVAPPPPELVARPG